MDLGVPADSADCFYLKVHPVEDYIYVLTDNRTYTEQAAVSEYRYSDFLPCWSVGRLIEIYLTCALEYHPYDDFYAETPSLHLMAFDKDRLIEEVIEIMSEDEMDFSKLEN